MKTRICTLLSITLVCCLFSSTVAFAAPESNSSSIRLVDGQVEEKVTFIDTDGIGTIMEKTTRPNDTFELTTTKNGESVTIQGTSDYQTVLSYVNGETSIQSARTKEVYIGTVSGNTYIGPEYKTASDLARILSTKMNLKLSIALEMAANIFDLFYSPVPLWIKKVTSTYEVHGDGDIGFLGWYHMYDSFYTYNHSDTTGPDYIDVRYSDREDTTPGW